jgi:O-antigen biosynthesis protein WbqP
VTAAAAPAAATAAAEARRLAHAVGGEDRDLAPDVGGAAVGAVGVLAQTDELFEVRLALHAHELVDRHGVDATTRRLQNPHVPDVPYPAAKRALDTIVAAALLVATSPVSAAATALTVFGMLRRPRDRGPLLYRERRISAGREFDLLKFRTLRRDVLERVRAEGSYARLAEAEEANLTWSGRILKRWYLDELPQLLNVLRGDLSLVGPRPWPVQMVVAQREAGLDYRDHVVAGLTGPAQVRKDSDLPVKGSDLDLEYVERLRTLSPGRLVATDLAILTDTVRLLARGEGLRF